MELQTITRQALLDRVSGVIKNLSDEQLQQAAEQIDAWVAAAEKATEPLEFTVSPRASGRRPYLRLPLRATKPSPKAVMEVGEAYCASSFLQQLHANIVWWNQNYAALYREKTLVGHYIAISGGEVFVAETYEAAFRKACDANKDATPYIIFLNAESDRKSHAD